MNDPHLLKALIPYFFALLVAVSFGLEGWSQLRTSSPATAALDDEPVWIVKSAWKDHGRLWANGIQ